jgi:acyl carrier protein
MAAADRGVGRYLERVGINALTPAQAVAALGRVLTWNPVQVGVMDVDWQAWSRSGPAGASPRFSALVEVADRAEGSTVATLRRTLRALSAEAAAERFTALVADQIAATLRVSPDKIDMRRSLASLGADSLMALEVQSRLRERLGMEISPLALMKEDSVSRLVDGLLVAFLTAADDTAVDDTAVDDPPGGPLLPIVLDPDEAAEMLAMLDQSSDDVVERLFSSLVTDRRYLT